MSVVCGRQSKKVQQVCLLLLASTLIACGGPRDPAEERVRRARTGTGDLVIAAPWPWQLRSEIRYGEGLQMAVDEVNAGGGIGGRRLRLAKYDDRESIDESRVIAQQISGNPDVVAVIGHLQSYTTLAAADVYDRAGLVLVAPTATAPELTQRGHKRTFRAAFTDEAVGRELAEIVVAHRWKRIAVYYIRNDYGRNVANAFEARAAQLRLDVSARSSYDPSEQAGERTFQQIVGEWRALDLDALVLVGEVPSAAIFVAQARRSGISAPILGGDAMSTPGLMAVAGAAADGMIVASFFHPQDPRPEVGRFTAAFSGKYGLTADAGSALGYDCVQLIAQAMRLANSPVPDRVAEAMHALKAWRGATGVFTFDANGEPIDRTIVKSVVRAGRFEFLATPAPGKDDPGPQGSANRAPGR